MANGITYAQSTSFTGTTGASAYAFNTFTGNELQQIITEKLSPRVEVLANKSAIFFSRIPSKSTPLNPRGLRIAVEKRANASQIFFAEGGKHSVGDSRDYISMNVFYSRFSQGSRLSLDALQAMEKGQALETLKDRMKQDTLDALRFLNFGAFGDGSNTRGIANSVATLTTGGVAVTMKTPLFSKAIQVGGRDNVYNSSGTIQVGTGQTVSYLTCTAIDIVAGTATFSTNTSTYATAVGDIFVKDGSYGLDVAGLDYLIDETSAGDIFGITRSTGNQFRAVVDRTGGALSVAKLNYVVQQFKHKKGADKWNPSDFVIVMSPAQFGAYLNLGDPTANATNSGVRLADTVKNGRLDLGYNPAGVYFQGIDIVEDDACPNDKIFIVNKQHLMKGEFTPLKAYSLQGDGKTLNKIPGFDSSGVGTYYDQSMYFLVWKGNLFTDDPSAHIKIASLDTVGLATGKI